MRREVDRSVVTLSRSLDNNDPFKWFEVTTSLRSSIPISKAVRAALLANGRCDWLAMPPSQLSCLAHPAI